MQWTDIPEDERRTLWEFAENVARAGAGKTLEFFGKTINIEWKADESPVTQADRETELLMRSMIQTHYPAHAVHGEEFGSDEHGEFTWVLDPIDGTKSFINGVPLYCSLVALLYNGSPVIGVILNPPSGEMVSGCMNFNTHDENGAAVQAAEPDAQLRVYTSDFVGLTRNTPKWYPKLLENRVIARTWGDAYGYMLIAKGRGDIMIDPELELWDVAPLYPVLHGAGAILCSIEGKKDPLPRSAVALSPQLYQRLFS